jgi:predicted NBD/HSP70 family sugar kinase
MSKLISILDGRAGRHLMVEEVYTRYVGAFSIEGRVDFSLIPYKTLRDGTVRRMNPVDEVAYSENISRDGEYFGEIYEHIYFAMYKVYEFAARTFGDEHIISLFNAINNICISIPGVIERNRLVVQLPLWGNWATEQKVTWSTDGNEYEYFDFHRELKSILLRIASAFKNQAFHSYVSDHWSYFCTRIEVYNDVAASAAWERACRQQQGLSEAEKFLLVYLGDGINVGCIEEGYNHPYPTNTELGHLYPHIFHPDDIDKEFEGTCHFHKNCFEGLIGAQSFAKRRELAKGAAFKNPEPDRTASRATAINLEKYSEAERERVEDILGFYLAQMVYTITLMPLAPDNVVFSGYLASEGVLEKVKKYFFENWKGYPARTFLAGNGIDKFISKSLASRDENIRLNGASEIAFYRATVSGRRGKLRSVA